MCTNYVHAIYNALQNTVDYYFKSPIFAYTQSLWQILCRDSEFNLWETAVFTIVK